MNHSFSVWAPKRNRISVSIDGKSYAMQGPDKRGWWTVDLELPAETVDYAFLVDDDPHPYPDPRSPWQPHGVHEASRTYLHSRFAWSDAEFRPAPLASAIVYELHVGTFTPEGTLDSAIAKLDHLVSLGITHVELMPVAAFEGDRGWGYDGVALYAPQQGYGGPDGLKRFVDACHARGLAVLLDVVYNHFGPSGNYTGVFGPYINQKHTTPWGGAVNFESKGADQVRRFFIDNALMWLRDYHIDGLRLDAVHEFIDRSALHVLEQMSVEVDDLSATLGKQLVLIAESDLNDPRLVTPREANGYGLAAQWSDDFHHALHACLTGETSGYYDDFGSLAQLGKALEHVFIFDGEYSEHRKREHGRPVTTLSFHHFLGYAQNHDQIGNRAQGDRLCHLVSFERAQIAAAIVLTSAFVPMLFQGEEWAASSPFQYFADHQDETLRKGVAKGRKQEFATFGWKPEQVPDPEAPEAFHLSKLLWSEINKSPHDRMLAWYRELISLRRSSMALNHGEAGSVHVHCQEQNGTLHIERGVIHILVNLGGLPQVFEIGSGYSLLLANCAVQSGADGLTLPVDGVAIITF